jgi:hypothetical protein
MLISAEVRWFWRGTTSTDVQQWFCWSDAHPFPSGGGKPRTDQYLRDPPQVELGVKHRGDALGVEIKGLVTLVPETIAFGQFERADRNLEQVEFKQPRIDASLVIGVQKHRWLRKFDTGSPVPVEIALDTNERPVQNHRLPQEGCNIELTKLQVLRGDDWWTLGFEAFGAFERVRDNLHSVAQIISTRQPPELQNVILASYPKWLAECIGPNAS